MAKKRYSDYEAETVEPVPEDAALTSVPEEAPASIPETAPETAPEDVPVVVVVEAPSADLPRVGVPVFAQVCGLKPDQIAGFVRWASNEKLVARTIPEWKQALSDYANRPV